MRFWKMSGAGNDFIIVDGRDGMISEERAAEMARVLCRRRLSIGADGLMVVERPRGDADLRMRFYNCDGSAGEMCGNGARCICRYGYENGLAGEEQRVETTAGLVTGRRVDRRSYRVRLNDPAKIRLDFPVEAGGRTYRCSYVELGDPGVPHAVVRLDGLRERGAAELRELGRALRYHPAFPKGANVNFYEPIGPDRFYERTYERGVEDLTYACGTGTGCTAVVLALQGKVGGGTVWAEMAGGELAVDMERTGARITDLYLTGPTNVVAKGEITDEDFFG